MTSLQSLTFPITQDCIWKESCQIRSIKEIDPPNRGPLFHFQIPLHYTQVLYHSITRKCYTYNQSQDLDLAEEPTLEAALGGLADPIPAIRKITFLDA